VNYEVATQNGTVTFTEQFYLQDQATILAPWQQIGEEAGTITKAVLALMVVSALMTSTYFTSRRTDATTLVGAAATAFFIYVASIPVIAGLLSVGALLSITYMNGQDRTLRGA